LGDKPGAEPHVLWSNRSSPPGSGSDETAAVLFRRTRVIDIDSSVPLVERQLNAALQIVIAPRHGVIASVVICAL